MLPRLIDALERQTGVDSFEVVVVDDGSRDETWRALERLAAQARVPVVTVRLDENAGPARARNAGWRKANGSVVAFTDDDCIPQPGWLAALAGRMSEADVVQGRTLVNPDQANERGAFSHVIHIEDEDGFFATCNIAYKRDLLERLDGFDEAIRYRSAGRRQSPVYGEDTELGLRARAAGARVRFEPEALVLHEVWPSSFRARLQKARRVESIPGLIRRHPALRQQLYWRWFYQPWHPPALLAAAGVALALAPGASWWRRLVGLACCLPYADNRTRRNALWTRRRHQVVLLPASLVADLYEVGILLRASIRERTLLI